jgi:4'-phosphopantetheinyl transferase
MRLPVRILVQAQGSAPPDDEWLSEAEARRLSGMAVPKRRSEWRLGRWTAKTALADCLGLPLEQIEIRPAPDGAPEAFLRDGERLPWVVSISHRDGLAVCALAPEGAALGCDLECVEPHGGAFVEEWFTPEEQALVRRASAGSRPLFTSLIWSAKESALKALRTGLRASPRSARVRLHPGMPIDGWRPLLVECDGACFSGWWQRDGQRLLTLVASPEPEAPLGIGLSSATDLSRLE